MLWRRKVRPTSTTLEPPQHLHPTTSNLSDSPRQPAQSHASSPPLNLEQLRGVMHGLFGGPGTGKSYVDDAFQRWLQENNVAHSHVGCAFTGKAAAHQGYTTLHKAVGIKCHAELSDDTQMGASASKALQELQSLYERIVSMSIDEISLVGAPLFAVFWEKLKLLKYVNPGLEAVQLMNLFVTGDIFQKVQPGSTTVRWSKVAH